MKVREVLNRKKYEFRDIEVGDLFYYHRVEDHREGRYERTDLYMKIKHIDIDKIGDKEVNTVNLQKGEMCHLNSGSIVKLVDAEIVITEIKEDFAIGDTE